jgi:hypothetical protein
MSQLCEWDDIAHLHVRYLCGKDDGRPETYIEMAKVG